MIQGKLEVVKQKMSRVNIDILGISELKLDMSVPATEEKGLCAGNFQAVREKAWPSGAWGMEPRKGRLTIQLHEDVDS